MINYLQKFTLKLVPLAFSVVLAKKVLGINKNLSITVLTVYILGNLASDRYHAYLVNKAAQKHCRMIESKKNMRIKTTIACSSLAIIFGLMLYGKDYKHINTYLNTMVDTGCLLGTCELIRLFVKSCKKSGDHEEQ
jgi:hypothetical protein